MVFAIGRRIVVTFARAFYDVLKYPKTLVAGIGATKLLKAKRKIVSSYFSPFTSIRKTRVVMKIHIVTQVKNKESCRILDFPTFGNTGL
jgi:hypothetical protein